MKVKIALAGNPNSGKTTFFNALTGANQYVGNWPGVTVEKKEGKLKKHEGVTVTDLPGIYSLSPYTLEEVVARNYLINEQPDVILNIVDASNLERNLYLTTQLTELGIPVVVALNMMDVVKKRGDSINIERLSAALGCKVVAVSAIKGEGVTEAAETAVEQAKLGKTVPMHKFSGAVEHAIAHIEEEALHDLDEGKQRWYAIKIFERDEKAIKELGVSAEKLKHIESDIRSAETELDDDAESIISNERYVYIAEILKGAYKRNDKEKLTVSDKIDRVVTHRVFALPIFAVIMFLVYFISVTTIGGWTTDWVNDGVFGDGWHLLGIGAGEYTERADAYSGAKEVLDGYIDYAKESGFDYDYDSLEEAIDAETKTFDKESAYNAAKDFAAAFTAERATYTVVDEETLVEEENSATHLELDSAVNELYSEFGFVEPDPADFGVWVKGLPVLIGDGLESINTAPWLEGLILDGIVAGLGAVLGFVPQIFVLFIMLALLEGCGYMARIAFVLDRVFRKFGLSGKSFIPMLIGTGCGVPGIMASRTIESERDRRMTITTTTFIPCSAKLPFIAMIAGVVFGGAWWVAPSAYFIGIGAIIISGVMLKKTKRFAGDPAPFVMELPSYHMPTLTFVIKSMWERGWSFIKKAGTIIFLSTIVVWFTSYFGFSDGAFRMLAEEEMDMSMLSYIGRAIGWIFAPLGFGTWQAAVASITGIVAKENIVATLGIVYGGAKNMAAAFTAASGMAFLVFNLLCAPCFAAIGAIRREMNSAKWTWFAIGYQCGFAYVVSFIFYRLIGLFTGELNGVLGWLCFIIALGLIAGIVYMMIRPYKESQKLEKEI